MATEKDRCIECGDLKLLNKSGVCRNRHSCQHRQFQHVEETKRLLRQMEIRESRSAVLTHPWFRSWKSGEGD